jgi:hypothetical protein
MVAYFLLVGACLMGWAMLALVLGTMARQR